MKLGGLLVLALLAAACSDPVPLTAGVDLAASRAEVVGSSVQLVVMVTNTGPLIPHVGLVFRTADRWYERHKVTELAGCAIASDASAFDCGDLAAGETKTYTFSGIATVAGIFHYELAVRELVQPFDYVDDHPDGPDVQTWDETVTPAPGPG
jgi:hypothetical protein